MKQKFLKVYLPSAMVLTVASSNVFAADVQTALSTAFTQVQTDLMATILTALPIGLGIIGAVFGIKKGIAFFKTLANKA